MGPIKSCTHQESPQSAGQLKSAKTMPVGCTEGAQSKVAARQLRNDVRLRDHSQSDQKRACQCSCAGASRPQYRHSRGGSSEEANRNPRSEESVEQITRAESPRQQ